MRARAIVASIGAALLYACPAEAHEKWFYDSSALPLRWDLFFAPVPLTFFAAVIVATLIAAVLWRKRRYRDFIPGPELFGTDDRRRRIVYAILPLIIGVHFAVTLVVNGAHTVLFSPDDKVPGAWAYIFGVCETGIALAFFYGGFTRLAAVALGALWFAGLFVVGVQTMLENILFLGAAAFFFMAGRGPLSIDRLMFPLLEPSDRLMRHAVLPLRVGLGLSLTVVAFTEKFANLPLATHFLEKYPLNFTAALGLPMSSELFMLCAASIELGVGLFLTFGIFPREVIIIAWLPFNLTLSVFNTTELIGHLPIYGIMALLVIWIPADQRNLDDWTDGLARELGPLRV